MAEISISSTKLAALLLVGILTSTLLSVAIISLIDRASNAVDDVGEQNPKEKLSWNSGMGALAAYQCRKAETKQIIRGGVEDNFAEGADGKIALTPKHTYIEKRIGPQGSATVDRGYDEAGFDRFFLDTVEIPTQLKSGIFVVSTRSLTQTSNDSLYVGNAESHWRATEGTSYLFGKPEKSPDWTASGDILTAKLSDMKFPEGRNFPNGEPMPREFDNLLEYIAAGDGDLRQIDVLLGDDHIIDFFGFAVCLPPERHMGLTFQATKSPLNPDYITLGCADETGEQSCNPHGGDMFCSASLPLACFKPGNEPIPKGLSDNSLEDIWTGGELRFSDPIAGDALDDAADAHALCRKEFGRGFRAATHQERANRFHYMAKGSLPSSKRAWVHAKTEPYGNCWSIDAEYEAARP